MKVIVKKGDIEKHATNVLVIPIFSDVEQRDEDFSKIDNVLGRAMSQGMEDNPYLTKENALNMFFTNKRVRADRVLLAGLGQSDKLTTESIRKLGGNIAKHLKGKNAKDISVLGFGLGLKNIDLDKAIQSLVEGVLLGNYNFDTYKTKDKENKDKEQGIETLQLIPQNEFDMGKTKQGAEKAQITAEAVLQTRDLINKPANVVTPAYLAKFAKDMTKNTKIKCKVLNYNDLKKEKMNLIVAVGQGSKNEPCLIKLDYQGAKGKKTYALVGKGVCFDTGGVNLKGSGHIETMKYDMSGAATVLGIVKAVARLKLPINLVAITPCVENHIDGGASRPSDIIKSYEGKYVEIANTDAEGRLILADALAYAQKSKPDVIIDFATLTGACVVSLGNEIAGILGNDDELINKIIKSGKSADELMWQLPLLDFHKDHIKSDVADIKNLGKPKGNAGTISAAAFLQAFVGETPWAHLDIAGVAFTKSGKNYTSKGATGATVRSLIEFFEQV